VLVILPGPIVELQHAPLPPKCCEPGSVLQLFALSLVSHVSFAFLSKHYLGVFRVFFPHTKVEDQCILSNTKV